MRARLGAIARRRAALAHEIRQQRIAQHIIVSQLRQEVAFAAVGLVVGRLLVRRPWLRRLALGALGAFAARRIVRG